MFDFARRHFEKRYDSTMTVKIWEDVEDGPFTKGDWVNVVENEPCRISKKQLNPTSSEDVAGMSYILALYCAPEIEVKAGSRILITNRYGEVREYKRSSEGFDSYATHQEIIIMREEKA